MSIESAKAFFVRMKTDEGLRHRMNAAEDKEARLAIIKLKGFNFTEEELKEVGEKFVRWGVVEGLEGVTVSTR